MYQIKQLPEDFIVKELIDLNFNPQGKYSYFKLIKKNFSTLKAIQILQNRWHVNKIGFAGLKDKQAVTEQFCSVQGVSKDKLSLDLQENNSFVKTEFIGAGIQPISLGAHNANFFEITVRNLSENFQLPTSIFKPDFINFFGEQRFSKNNAEIGELLIKRDFKSALNLILENHPHYKTELEPYINSNNFISALRKIPKKLLLLYLNAFQSKIWNILAKTHANKYKSLPLIGFGIQHELLNSFPYKPRDFLFKEFPELSLEGSERQTIVSAENLKISELKDDDINSGMKKITLSFILPKGSYATEFIKQILSHQ